MTHTFSPRPDRTALKICGVTRAIDAQKLSHRGVAAMGINFWVHSKRFISPMQAEPWLKECSGKILRIGVFVNPSFDHVCSIYGQGLIDYAQLHGHESPDFLQNLTQRDIPCIKAFGVASELDFSLISSYHSLSAVLLDTHAPSVYGGTGIAFDWNLARQWMSQHPDLSLILAGGIQTHNLSSACELHPSMIDVASGAESAPGVKDFEKIDAMIRIMRDFSSGNASNS